MAERTHEFHRYAEVVAALADPALAPVPPAESAQAAPHAVGTAAWLRGQVARFARGLEHVRRRAVVEAELARLDPAALRKAAAEPAAPDAGPRARAVTVLARALGLAEPERVAADVGLVSSVYFGGESTEADAALARLVEAYTDPSASSTSEEIANRISVLIQAYEATGALVERAAPHLADGAGSAAGAEVDVEAVVIETLRHDPPVLAMRRVAVQCTRIAGIDITEGDLVTLDIVAANRDPEAFDRPEVFAPGRPATPGPLTFGSEPRRCPGHTQAVALAAGILTSAREGEVDL